MFRCEKTFHLHLQDTLEGCMDARRRNGGVWGPRDMVAHAAQRANEPSNGSGDLWNGCKHLLGHMRLGTMHSVHYGGTLWLGSVAYRY